MLKFSKLHGLGNDYIIIDLFNQKVRKNLNKLSIKLSDRHFGVGSDGLITVEPSRKADFKMRIFNADGSEAQMCGNGLRCAVKFAYENKLIDKRKLHKPQGIFKNILKKFTILESTKITKVETGRGILTTALIIGKDGKVENICVNMSEPILEPENIPVKISSEIVVNHPFEIEGGNFRMTCISMGNPHAIFFVNNLEKIDLDRLGPAIEKHPIFPERTNVHFAEVKTRKHIKVITWERGSGRTLACGTGAAAVCVAGVLEGKTEKMVTTELPGGNLKLLWNEEDNCVYMLGPATHIFDGIYTLR